MARFIRAIGGYRNIATMPDATFMQYIVELILHTTERRITQYFDAIPKGQRVRMFRRLAKYVHPDKNAHKCAKEAF